jgi:uncharacterized protein involved in type VI secretion and phage assembly
MLQPIIADKKLNTAMVRSVGITQELGDHHRCTLDFSWDNLTKPRLEEFLGEPLVVAVPLTNGPTITIFEGFVSGGTLEHQLYGGSAIVLEAASQSSKLDWSRREAYYKQKPLNGVAKELGGKNGVKVSVNGSSGPALNYVQRGETDFEFLKRIADDCGSFVRPTSDGLEIRKGFNSSGLKLIWNSDLLWFQVSGKLNPLKVRGAHYDAKQKKGMRYQKINQNGNFTGAYDNVVSAVRSASSKVLGTQEHLEYHNARSVTLEDYKKSLENESRRALGASILVDGESRNPRLVPGDYVEIEKVPEGKGKYGLVRVIHSYDAVSGYRNHFWATPWSEYSSPQKQQRVLSSGVVTAMVVENNDPAKLNRLKIRYHWQEGGSTSWTRMVSQYSGKDRGVMFLPEVGDEVVVAFENGDPERPIIIGSVWNGKDLGPRNPYWDGDDLKKNEVKRIVTKSGNSIDIVDTEGKEVIQLCTANKGCLVQLNNKDKIIVLEVGESKLVMKADGTIRLTGVDIESNATKQNTLIGGRIDINR